MPKVYPRVEARYPPELVEQVCTLYIEGMTRDEVAHEVGLTEMIVRRLLRRRGIPARRAVSEINPAAETLCGRGMLSGMRRHTNEYTD